MTRTFSSMIMTGLCGILCVAGTLVWMGCDTAGALDALTISPGSATLSSGQSQQFTVSGGYEYTWTLQGNASSTSSTSTAAGSLSGRTGNTIVYTAPTSSTALSGSVVLHVVSTIQGSGAGNTNSSAYAVSADAVITFH